MLYGQETQIPRVMRTDITIVAANESKEQAYMTKILYEKRGRIACRLRVPATAHAGLYASGELK